MIAVVLGSLALAGTCGTGIGWGASTQGVGWDSALDGAAGKRISVVVRARPGREAAVEAAVTRLGGHIELQLRIINGFSASLPTSAVRKLRNVRDLVSVSLDRHLQAMSSSYDPATDIGSMVNSAKIIGANAYYQAGYTGAGVTVALIDSGVVPVDGLTAAGKVINGPDLSYESQYPESQYMDTYGHGTFMAGLIAGKSSSGDFQGMAPDARLLSIKVADAHGNTDVSQVIAAIDWVVQHRNDNGMNVRVLNMSYGTDSGQPYSVDPLAYAAEQAWKNGIVVVAAAGNAGFAKGGSMTDPAYDPMLLSVGAADTAGTLSITDDAVASFSSNGVNGGRTVDVLVPGAHIVSLRDPGSYIDQTYGSTGYVTDRFFRGSGTSEAAAIASGAAALIIQQRPNLTPDQVKNLILGSATKLSGSKQLQGGGELNLAGALSYIKFLGPQFTVASTGLGSLELARGSIHVSMNGVTLTGEQDIFGMPFVSATMAASEALGSSWSGSSWSGSSWSGSSWSGSSWSGSSWSGSSWSGSSWSGSSWSGSSWSGSSWSGSSWSGSSWSGSSWSGSSWSGSSWSDANWAGSSWSTSDWS